MTEMLEPRHTALSRLESLPMELIQKIFFHALEFNMPLASPSLTASLSSQAIYKSLVLLAFSGHNFDQEMDLFDDGSLPVNFSGVEKEGMLCLQDAILKCRWSTLDLFWQCQRDFIAEVVQKKWNSFGLQLTPAEEEKLENLKLLLAKPLSALTQAETQS